jgi:hypothetical protein
MKRCDILRVLADCGLAPMLLGAIAIATIEKKLLYAHGCRRTVGRGGFRTLLV